MAIRKRKDGAGGRSGRRRGGPGCLSVIFLTLFVLTAAASTVAIFFKIRRIEVVGNRRYTFDQICSSAEIEIGDNLIFINKFEKISNIFSRLPYVDEIKMSRRLPDTLLIEVKECVAVAAFGDGSSYWLISEDGKVLEQLRQLPKEHLILVEGSSLKSPQPGEKARIVGDEEDGEMRFSAMVDALEAIIASGIAGDVDELSIEKVYNVELRYQGRFRVRLGMPEHLAYKIDCLKEIVDGYLGPGDRGIIDLSELVDGKPAKFIPDMGEDNGEDNNGQDTREDIGQAG